MSSINIREANSGDTQQILDFILELAIYEKAEHEAKANAEHIHATLFCESPKVHALIAESNGSAVGFAVYFYNYSTWLGKHGIYLEDLYVSPTDRGSGAGKALLKELSKIAVANDCGRVEWSVLDWNITAIDFYLAMGAKPQDEWTVYRLTGDALNKFAAS
ncbi:MAG: GNAT superfamily N-acetyltransferase [Arenicella sp.]